MHISGMLASLAVVAAGCVYGPKLAEFGPAQTPYGVQTEIVLQEMDPDSTGHEGELLALHDTEMMVLVDSQVVRVPLAAIRKARFEDLNILSVGAHQLGPRKRKHLSLLSRYPRGLQGEMLDDLLRRHNQSAPASLAPPAAASAVKQPSIEGEVLVEPLLGVLTGETFDNNYKGDISGFNLYGVRFQKYRDYERSFLVDVLVKRRGASAFVSGKWVMVSASLGGTVTDRDANGVYGVYLTAGLGAIRGTREYVEYNYLPEADSVERLINEEDFAGIVLPVSVIMEIELTRWLLLRLAGSMYLAMTPWLDERGKSKELLGPGFGLFPGIAITF